MGDAIELPRVRRFWVNTETCIDQRRCVIEAPLFVSDSEQRGGPIITSDRPGNEVEMLALLNAAWVCPTASFKLELEDGSVRDSSDRDLRELCKAWSKVVG
ncbi:MAG: ferredoxin [Gammaproteobacteria bacterium]|nr:ferredoxin [Gammaproteobacteria bacterium]